MPAKDTNKIESQTATTWKIKITNAVVGSPFSLYLGDNPRRYTQGTFQNVDSTIEIPADSPKNARLQTTKKRTTRLDVDVPIVVDFKPSNTTIINLAEKYDQTAATAGTNGTGISAGKKLIKNTLRQEVQEKKAQAQEKVEEKNETPKSNKIQLENKLKEQVEAKKKGDPKQSLWDRIK